MDKGALQGRFDRGPSVGGPPVAVTMGDPAGIGPEIIACALAGGLLPGTCRPLVVGDEGIMARAIGIAAPGLTVRPVKVVADCAFETSAADGPSPGSFRLVDPPDLDAILRGWRLPVSMFSATH